MKRSPFPISPVVTSIGSTSLMFICGLLWLSVVLKHRAVFSMRRVTGWSPGLRPGASGALAPRASSLARRWRRGLCVTDQRWKHRRFKRGPGFGWFGSQAVAVEVLDGLPFPPELAMTGSYVEHPVTVAGQVLLGEREFSLRIFAVEEVQAVDAAGDAQFDIREGVFQALALVGLVRVYRTLIRATRR